ncbi:hypothetical protein PR202_ga15263 [Eleusine coracana subsp. coracana]|uniref:RING-type E3 ubiquitin transferase n=1 Tax=Eleusine coracana subsp. coracana TaxID=191504 RepID=A0AAV5CIM1_ELECO|nr:hypothetical protein QOZ80_6BG0495050 [Eleusine coracana subsp. coracana]GJM98273.1 hypothetical protein PR202_ga15263 [Eleusine coracana subsp. coracana]
MPGVATSTTLQYTGIAVFVAVVLYVVLYYSRSFESVFLTRRHDASNNLATTGLGGDAARPGPVQALGLGPDDVAALPTFTYHSAAASPDGKARADCCAVCLEELREGALVRMLASCKHYFHAGCVDVWLLSHATCPVCRGSPGQEMVRLGVASISPPLPQLRRCGAPWPDERGGASSLAEKDVVSSSSPSPVMRSPMRRFEISTTGNGGSAAMSPSPTHHQPRTPPPEGRVWRTRSPSPVTTGASGVVQV